MKILKILFSVLLWIIGIVAVLILTLPLWIGSVVKPIANAIVPTKTGTRFNLGTFELNQYSGRLLVGDIQLYNPPQFDQQLALTLGSIQADIDVPSVATDTIVIREVVVKDVFVSYVSDGKGKNNFDSIIAHAKGETKAKDGAAQPSQQIAAKKPMSTVGSEKASAKTEEKGSEHSAKKVIIDRLTISGVLVQWGKLTLPLPAITLRDIGRGSNGVTIDQAWSQIYGNFLKNMGVFGDSLKSLGINVGNVTESLQNAGVDKAVKALDAIQKIKIKESTNGAIDSTNDALKDAAGALKEFFK